MQILNDDNRDVALLAWAMLAEVEDEAIEQVPAAEPDYEAAATVYLLADAGCSLVETGAYMRGERRPD